ncbi:hypothetical protein AGMMS49938_09890 [Fibrobacterales bacterium]|nr:hypothetical protein AGMMS49938_09890 [Fibrobacterales bacterium]
MNEVCAKRAIILECIIFLLLTSCAPLKPLSPNGAAKSTTTSYTTATSQPQTSAKNQPSSSSSPAKSQNSTQTITGIAEWDIVLVPWLDTPYLYGGTTKNGTDCSGFVSGVFAEKENLYIPRTTKEEFKQGTAVEKSKLTIGDLVFFGERGVVSHVGLYVGDGKMIHASTNRGVTVTPLSDSYWVPRYMGARRYF